MDGGKDAAGAVVVYLQVVDADDPVVGGDLFLQLPDHLRVRRLAQQRAAGFHDEFDARDGDENGDQHADPAVNGDGSELVDQRAQQHRAGGKDVV